MTILWADILRLCKFPFFIKHSTDDFCLKRLLPRWFPNGAFLILTGMSAAAAVCLPSFSLRSTAALWQRAASSQLQSRHMPGHFLFLCREDLAGSSSHSPLLCSSGAGCLGPSTSSQPCSSVWVLAVALVTSVTQVIAY